MSLFEYPGYETYNDASAQMGKIIITLKTNRCSPKVFSKSSVFQHLHNPKTILKYQTVRMVQE